MPFDTPVALEEAGHLDEAEGIYLHLLDTGRESGLVWLNLGNVRLEQGLTNEAQAAYSRALDLEPNQPTRSTISPGCCWNRNPT